VGTRLTISILSICSKPRSENWSKKSKIRRPDFHASLPFHRPNGYFISWMTFRRPIACFSPPEWHFCLGWSILICFFTPSNIAKCYQNLQCIVFYYSNFTWSTFCRPKWGYMYGIVTLVLASSIPMARNNIPKWRNWQKKYSTF